MLSNDLTSYLATRRALGSLLRDEEIYLRSFVRWSLQRGQTHVHAQTAIEWASQAPSPGQRARRLGKVIRLARYLRAEDPGHEVPSDSVFGHHRKRRVPYVFSREEIERLLLATARLFPAGSLVRKTYTTFFALLAATGLRVREALALRLEDLSEDGLVIRQTKFHKSRLVPLHPTVDAALKHYLDSRRRVGGACDHLFVSARFKPLRYGKVNALFLRAARRCGLHPGPGMKGPHLHDLRHAFAVRSLESSPHDRDRVDRHILALATYMGHANVSSTYWYLTATPQLLSDIADVAEATFLRGGR